MLPEIEHRGPAMRLHVTRRKKRYDPAFDCQQLIDIGLIDVIADLTGKWRAIDPVAVENEPAQILFQALEVEKYQGGKCVDQHAVVMETEPVVADIPRREVGPDIRNDVHALKPAWE